MATQGWPFNCATCKIQKSTCVPRGLTKNLVEQAKVFGSIEHRSVPKQIEYWSQIGKIAQENPDLPFSLIREILVADQEPVVGEYVFS